MPSVRKWESVICPGRGMFFSFLPRYSYTPDCLSLSCDPELSIGYGDEIMYEQRQLDGRTGMHSYRSITRFFSQK